ncbi:MAG: pilus assembly protein [Endomicrobia bacterium]|jgi:Tfp pilus assembly protein PilV|nr:pilus assembly protein [Endomicrobiia bacterium]
MKKNSKGQTMVEALFVVFFTTIIMFAFLQICIMVVDDMTANEAAFVAVRSAVVTENTKRLEEATERVKHYFEYYYYGFSKTSGWSEEITSRSFNFSNKKTVEEYYLRWSNNNSNNQNRDSEEEAESTGEEKDKSVTIWPKYSSQVQKHTYDYSGNASGSAVSKRTVKIYYYTRVMFGTLVARRTSNARGTSENDKNTLFMDRKIWKIGGNRRYQSARGRMMVSPDQTYYEKAYPEAKKFKNYDAKSLMNKFFGS